jgi:hypothetical protein
MTAGNASRVIRAPGRLVVAPTNLGVAYPYGGVEVGKTRLVVVRVLGTNVRVESEGLGEATDVLERQNHFVFSCFLRGWDDDAIEQLWPDNFTVGAATGHAVFDAPGRSVPGASMLDRAKVLLYVPDNVAEVPAVLIYRGVPDWSDSAEMAFQRGDELGLPLAVECLRSASGRILKIGRLADLSLT